METRSDGVVMSGAWDWALSEVTNSVIAAGEIAGISGAWDWALSEAPSLLRSRSPRGARREALELGGIFGLGEAIALIEGILLVFLQVSLDFLMQVVNLDA